MDWKRNKKFSFEIFFLLFLDVTHTFVGLNHFFSSNRASKMFYLVHYKDTLLVKHDIVFLCVSYVDQVLRNYSNYFLRRDIHTHFL